MMKLSYQLIVKDKDGNIKSDTGKMDAHSWVKQAAQFFEFNMKNADGSGIKDLNSIERAWDISSNTVGIPFDISDSTTGVFVGTGSTAVTSSDVVLDAAIPDGTSAGRLVHGAPTIYEGILGTSTGWTHLIERDFQNDSGATITINEVGVYTKYDTNTGAGTSPNTSMLIRDVLGTGVAVLDGESAVVRYFFDWDV